MTELPPIRPIAVGVWVWTLLAGRLEYRRVTKVRWFGFQLSARREEGRAVWLYEDEGRFWCRTRAELDALRTASALTAPAP